VRAFRTMQFAMGHDLPRYDVDALFQQIVANMEAAAYRIANHAQGLWVGAAQAHGLRNKGPGSYVGGIRAEGNVQIVEATLTQDRFMIVLEIRNTAPHALYVDEGHSAFHLPSKIDWSRRTGRIKWGKNGPYLHIPFRHSAYQSPSQQHRSGMTADTLRRMMPERIYGMARRLAPTRQRLVGPVFRVSKTPTSRVGTIEGGRGRTTTSRAARAREKGAQVQFQQADRYSWGDRLQGLEAAGQAHVGQQRRPDWTARAGQQEHRGRVTVLGAGPRGGHGQNPEWGSNKYEGMFRAEHMGSSGRRSSQYMTIRTITPDSRGWNIPAQHGKHIVDRVAGYLEDDSYPKELMAGAIMDALNGMGG
jgi:hypothetical protein